MVDGETCIGALLRRGNGKERNCWFGLWRLLNGMFCNDVVDLIVDEVLNGIGTLLSRRSASAAVKKT